jgi:cellulose synthase/poly-beta-1,6-N-acetylglucosamine synthase-like glycosyltransferase
MALTTLIWLVFFIVLLPSGYLLLLALSSWRSPDSPKISESRPSRRFAIAIPAHNEENVIGDTVNQLRKLDFPNNLFDIHIVADYCTDKTTAIARAAGAFDHDRNEGPRTGKGAALS